MKRELVHRQSLEVPQMIEKQMWLTCHDDNLLQAVTEYEKGNTENVNEPSTFYCGPTVKKTPKEISHNCLSFTLLLWCSMNGQDFISRKSCKMYKNTIKSPKCMPSFLFSKAFQWAGLESLTGWFWASNLMFDTPGLEYDHHRHTDLHVRTGALFNSCSSLLFGRDSQSEGFFWGCKHEGRFYSEDS